MSPRLTLAAAGEAHVAEIAELWHRGWHDGHVGHVPPALHEHRGLGRFRQRVPARLPATTVALIESRVVGFVVTHDDEIEQLYVDAAGRGTGIADSLLRHGETAISRQFTNAWLAVVGGNARARRFYERHGWADTGVFDYPAEATPGSSVIVPAHRYEKRMSALSTDDSIGGTGASR